MAKVGEILLQHEEGWRRYEEDDSNFTYIDGKYAKWHRINDINAFSSSYAMSFGSNENNSYLLKVRFNIVSDKIRIVTFSRYYNSNFIQIKIDSTPYIFECRSYNLIKPTICFEKLDLKYKEHCIEITSMMNSNTNNSFYFDAVDIDENGILKPYNSNLYKNLVEQNENYYFINNNYINLGEINKSEELDNLITDYGYNDLSIITKELINKNIPMKLENHYYKSFDIDLNNIKDNINLIEEDDKKYIQYGCDKYRILDKIKEINNGKFDVIMKENH